MSEKSMSRTVMDALIPLHPIRIENYCSAGTPDINYREGWIENKEMPAWPVDPRWHLRIPHFTVEQRIWLDKRWRYGGNAHLLLKVGSDWMLIAGNVASKIIGEATAEEIKAASALTWKSRDPGCWGRLVEHLRKGRG